MIGNRAVNSDSFMVTTPSDVEIRMTRLFDAPRQLVFEAMTKPEHIKRWWGILDDTYSVPVAEVDLRVGGKWKYVNKFPKGECCFYGEYKEIDATGRIVFTEIFEPFPESPSLVTVELKEENGKTRFTITAKYPSLEVRDQVIQSGMERGAALSYDHLEEVASRLASR